MMNNVFYEFNGHYYAIDMDKFMEFVSHNPNGEKDTNTVITQVFADTSLEDDEPVKEKSIGDFRAVSKEITESKANNNTAFNNVRYDFIRILLNTIMSPYYSPDGTIIKVENDDDLFLGQKIAFNTLLHNGIIFEINNPDINLE